MLVRTCNKFIGPNHEIIEELGLVDSSTLAPPLPSQVVGTPFEDEPQVIYLGYGAMIISITLPNGQSTNQPQEVNFQIEANNLTEAFTNFEKYFRARSEEIKQQYEEHVNRTRNGIVVPSARDASSLADNLNGLKIAH